MLQERIADLMVKHITGTANPEETACVEAWLNEKPGRRQQVQAWATPEALEKEFKTNWPKANEMERLRSRLHQALQHGKS